MLGPAPGTDIINACRLLFPASGTVNPGFLNTIANEDLKAAFRKKALKTHPDRSKALGQSREELNRLFQELTSAYRILETYFMERDAGARTGTDCRKTPRPTTPVKKPGSDPKDYFYTGMLPERELRLGEFLYYSKVISWSTLIGAIVWQKKKRPLFGQIARQWAFLSDDDIRLILRHKSRGEVFGEFARRHGLISRYQQMAITGRQRQLQPLIGMNFVEKGLLTVVQMNMQDRNKNQHNRRIRQN